MKSHIVTTFLILIITLMFLFCQKDNSSISNYESMMNLDGKWIHKQIVPGYNDTLLTIYQFMNNTKFEEGRAEVSHSHNSDTIYFGGNYQIPAPRLLFLSYNNYRHGDTINTSITGWDTLVFWKQDKLLELSAHGRSFIQISGNPNQLVNSKFYDVLKLGHRYFHDMYYFFSDSLWRYSQTSQSAQLPSNWPAPAKYKIKITNRYVDIETYPGTINRISYLFYNGRLILTEAVRNFDKTN